VIPGALAVREVKENVSRIGARIPSDLWSELKREKLLDPTAPTPN
jgi:D-threo-aldose 1-dehydrogenase